MRLVTNVSCKDTGMFAKGGPHLVSDFLLRTQINIFDDFPLVMNLGDFRK